MVNDGTAINLSGSANAGSTWIGWSGGTGSAAGCTGTGNCIFNITQNSGVTTTFTLIPSDPGPTPEPPPITEVIPNNSPQINYFGGWHSRSVPGTYIGSLMEIENITGVFSSMTLSFEGTSISWRQWSAREAGQQKSI